MSDERRDGRGSGWYGRAPGSRVGGVMIRFTRNDQSDQSAETLTLVRLDSDHSLLIQIETGTPDSWKEDPNDRTFVGLYSLDGDQIPLGNDTWEIAEEASFLGEEATRVARELGLPQSSTLTEHEVLEALMVAWERGTSVCQEAPGAS